MNPEVYGYLFGSVLSVTTEELMTIGGLSVVVLGTILLLSKELYFIAFDQEMAAASGVPARQIFYLLLTLVALTVVTDCVENRRGDSRVCDDSDPRIYRIPTHAQPDSDDALSNYQFEYSIIYALWDEEEIGLVGSDFFAEQADSNDLEIKGVLNFEMSGWDSNNDGKMDIHTKPISNSVLLGHFLFAIDSIYNLPLQPVIYNPGTTASDHNSFWQKNYSAICFSEAYYGGDFNPY